MLRQFLIWLMKVALDLAIFLSLLAGVAATVMSVERVRSDAVGWLVALEIVGGAFALVGLFGLLSLLIEINENLIRLRQTPVRRLEPQI